MTADDSSRRAQQPRRRRTLRRLVVLILAVVVFVGSGAGFFVGTEQGLKIAYALLQRTAPGVMSIGRIEGSLLGGPVLENIDLDLPAAHVTIGRLGLQWQPENLFQRELHITGLDVDRLHISLRETEPQTAEPPGTLPVVDLPLRLRVESLRLTDLAVVPPGDGDSFLVASLSLAATWEGTELDVSELGVVARRPAAVARFSGSASLSGDYPVAADLIWHLPPGVELAPLAGEGRVEGDLHELQIDHRTTGRLSTSLEGELADLLAVPAWRARISIEDLSPQGFVTDAPAGSATGSFTGAGTFADASVTGTVTAELEGLEALGSLEARVEAEIDRDLLSVKRLGLSASETPASLQARGTMQLAGQVPGRFELNAEWRDLAWPPGATPDHRAPSGSLNAAGTVDAFTHEISTRFESATLPAADVRWAGQGTLESLTVESLRVDTLGGHIDGTGELRWHPEISWSADLAAADLQPAVQWPGFRGRLDARVTTTGRMEDGVEARVQLGDLSGELQDRPVAGQGLAYWSAGVLNVEELSLRAGSNRMAVSGTAGETLGLEADIDAPDLSVLMPGAQGGLRLKGRVTGPLSRPALDGELAVRRLKFGDTGLEKADGRVRVGARRGDVLDVELRAAGVRAGTLSWDALNTVAKGSTEDHQFSIGAEGLPLAAQVSGQGSWGDDGTYSGDLQALEFESPKAGGWRLDSPAGFAVSGDSWELQTLCLSNTQGFGGGCVAANGRGGARWEVDADVPQLDLEAFAPLVPEGMVIEGKLSADARLTAEGGRLTGRARVEVPSGRSRLDLEDEDGVLDFSGTRLTLDAAGGDLDADVKLPLAGLGHIDGHARLPGWRADAPARAAQPVSASLKGRVPDLGPLAALVPEVADLAGSLAVDLTADGTLGASRVGGSIEVVDVAFDVPAVGVRISELVLTARSRSADVVDFDGSARLGDGRIDLDGEARLPHETGLQMALRVSGENLTVANVPEATVVVSPDLTFQIDDQLARLTGEVVVPEARLRPRGLPEGTVSASSDVVIKGDPGEGGALRLGTAADIRLKLRDKVSFDGFGLRGLFRGDLRITQEPGRLALGNGQLSIDDGTFVTFGEELAIEQGVLLFANTPVYDPGISIVARREVADATVGARVAGTLKKPLVTFFSDPPMGQAEALNYLLTGGRSTGSVSSAAQVVGGNLLVREAGRQFGLDDIGVTREAESDNLSMYVGTWLTPQLYMQYVSELGERANKVRLRYDLTPRVQVEAETGDVQSADIFYTIER